jgi:hypothetical protein
MARPKVEDRDGYDLTRAFIEDALFFSSPRTTT